MQKRYFVTGGAGFIGSTMVDLFLQRGHEVYTIDDLSTGTADNLLVANQYPHHHFFQQNALHFDWDAHLRAGDYIIHLAATVGVDYVMKDALVTSHNNLAVTQHVLDKCQQYCCGLLFTSTSEVYGNHDREYSSEEDSLCLYAHHGGRSAYTLSKLYGEFLCQEYARKYGLNITVLRLFNTIGARQSNKFGMVVPRFIHHALRDECLTVYGQGDQTRSFCHVSDTVRAIYQLSQLTAGAGEIYNIGNDVPVTMLELAHYIKHATGSTLGHSLLPLPRRAGRPQGHQTSQAGFDQNQDGFAVAARGALARRRF
ncbi:MAG: NAD-dependent epimerase/dehydratase family protein [Hymenobacter sp.]